MLRQMRTLSSAIAEIKEQDPGSCITLWHLRQMVLSGELPSHKVGRKYLICMQTLEAILGGEIVASKEDVPIDNSKMRRIGV